MDLTEIIKQQEIQIQNLTKQLAIYTKIDQNNQTIIAYYKERADRLDKAIQNYLKKVNVPNN